jgi:hypothetical protein
MFVIARPKAVIPAVLLGVVAAGSLSTALALTNDRVEVLKAPVPTAVELPSCEPVCASHVIASAVPGGPALVVDGASAFGVALGGPAGPAPAPVVQPVVPAAAPVPTTVAPPGGVALADASLVLAE